MATKVTEESKKGTGSNKQQRSNTSATFTGPLAPVEKALDGVLGENAPFKIPENGRKTLVKLAPWLALVSGIFGLLAALGLWRAAHYVNQWVDYANRISATYGGATQTDKLGVFFWISLVALLGFAVLALAAFSGLKARKKVGWDLMFYSAAANVIYGFVSIFYAPAGISSFFGTILATVVGLYLLFQIRGHYK